MCHRIKCFRVVSHLRGKVALRSWLYYYPHVTGEQCESWRSNLPEVTVLELGRTGVRTQICLLRERMCLTMMGHTLRTHLVTTPEAPSPGYSHSAFVPSTSFRLLFPPKTQYFQGVLSKGVISHMWLFKCTFKNWVPVVPATVRVLSSRLCLSGYHVDRHQHRTFSVSEHV